MAEDEHLVRVKSTEQLVEGARLVLLEHLDVDLLDAVDVRLLGIDRDLERLVGEAPREVAHLNAERRAEQRRLALRRAMSQ